MRKLWRRRAIAVVAVRHRVGDGHHRGHGHRARGVGERRGGRPRRAGRARALLGRARARRGSFRGVKTDSRGAERSGRRGPQVDRTATGRAPAPGVCEAAHEGHPEQPGFDQRAIAARRPVDRAHERPVRCVPDPGLARRAQRGAQSSSRPAHTRGDALPSGRGDGPGALPRACERLAHRGLGGVRELAARRRLGQPIDQGVLAALCDAAGAVAV